MTHFVSASCEGNLCSVCKAPATHKLGEEIPHDEPCMLCGGTWKRVEDELGVLSIPRPTDAAPCTEWYHLVRGVPRHNLTAYVCCAHFTMIVGPAAGCPPEKVMHAGIMKEAAERNRVLERENHELRDALIGLCDDYCSHKTNKDFVRAVRKAANSTRDPFDLNTIETAVKERRVDLAAIRKALKHWPTDWQSTTPSTDDCEHITWLAINRVTGETTEIDVSEEDYIAELGAFIALVVNTMPKALDEIERLR